jgi:hypothetical protein
LKRSVFAISKGYETALPASSRFVLKKPNLPKPSHVFNTDVKSYYTSIDHILLLDRLAEHVTDRKMVNLLAQYLRRTVCDVSNISDKGKPPLGLLSLTRATTELGLIQATVGMLIRSLENHLGSQVIHRRAHSLDLTEIGTAFPPIVRHALSLINQAT